MIFGVRASLQELLVKLIVLLSTTTNEIENQRLLAIPIRSALHSKPIIPIYKLLESRTYQQNANKAEVKMSRHYRQ